MANHMYLYMESPTSRIISKNCHQPMLPQSSRSRWPEKSGPASGTCTLGHSNNSPKTNTLLCSKAWRTRAYNGMKFTRLKPWKTSGQMIVLSGCHHLIWLGEWKNWVNGYVGKYVGMILSGLLAIIGRHEPIYHHYMIVT